MKVYIVFMTVYLANGKITNSEATIVFRQKDNAVNYCLENHSKWISYSYKEFRVF